MIILGQLWIPSKIVKAFGSTVSPAIKNMNKNVTFDSIVW